MGLPAGVAVVHRDELDPVQRVMREIKGCTVIIYDQTCATEKRRRRKRGTMVDPAVRVLINDLVCEGCGDCGVQSNCLSVEPLETEFGRKRTINQNTCNKDTSCLKGFCPSFVTVEGGQLKKKYPKLNTCVVALDLEGGTAKIKPAIAKAVKALGGVDILINCAGGAYRGRLEQIPDAAWERYFAVKPLGLIRMTREALPHLKKSPQGRVINISGTRGREPGGPSVMSGPINLESDFHQSVLSAPLL